MIVLKIFGIIWLTCFFIGGLLMYRNYKIFTYNENIKELKTKFTKK